MLSVLIVDDEEWIRLGIVSKLRKSRFNFSQILQEQSAEQALETAIDVQPDIVLCDIRMDGMDGLAFSHKLLELLPNTKIVIISGYNEFLYAKEAIRLGVSDYLLKPIDTASLSQALEKCVRQIELNQRHQSALSAVKKSIQRKTLRSAAADILTQSDPDYSQLFSNYIDGGAFLAYYLYLDISCSLSTDNLDDYLTRQFPELRLGENLIYYENQCNEFLIVLYQSPIEKCFEPEPLVKMLENLLYAESHGTLPCQYTIGVSAAHLDLRTAVNEAILCMKHRILCINKRILYPQDIAQFTSVKIDLAFLSDLKEILCRKDKNHMEAVLKSMYHSIEESSLSYETLQNVYLRVLILLGEHLSFPPVQPLQMPAEIYYFSSVWDWIDFLKELLTRFLENEQPASREEDPRFKLIGEIQAYIQENFSQKLSLSEIAQQKHINYCYLSLLFKDVANVTFQDYLMDVRLNHACQLLQTGQYKIKDVAELSGFSDQHYFSKIFKKITGYTPREYQQNKVL